MATGFNNELPPHPEYLEAVTKVLSQRDDLTRKDIARLSGLTQTQAQSALEKLVATGKVVVRKLKYPRKTLYRIAAQS